MNIWQALILGLVEGITEFLPISSTGHLILAARLLGIPPTDFLKSFEIVIQLGAISAIIFLYGRSLLWNFKIIKKVFVAFLPTALVGFTFYKVIKNILLGNHHVVLWSLFLGGFFLIIFERLYDEKNIKVEDLTKISLTQAFLIGVFQSIAMIPGVSRSAATIIGGLFLGLRRKVIVEFSFLLAVPTMLAASGLDLLKNASSLSSHNLFHLLIGFSTSFIVAVFSVKFLLRFIQRHNFISFGLYRIAIALALWRA